MRLFSGITLSVTTLCLAACATSGVDKAFTDNKSAVQGNSRTFRAPSEVTLRVVTGTLVQEGFAIEQVDGAMGLIRATRNLTDTKQPNTNYHISATAYVTADGAGSVVSLAASQQTVLYRKGHTWTMLPLIPIIPIPTGRKYDTVVLGEGSILDGTFYAQFFAAVERGLVNASATGATHLAGGERPGQPEPTAEALSAATRTSTGTPAAPRAADVPPLATEAPH